MSDNVKQSDVIHALADLHQRFYLLFDKEEPALPTIFFDSEWLSPCLVFGAESLPSYSETPQHLENSITTVPPTNWKPVEWGAQNAFDDLEKALEVSFHPDIICFYTSFWSDGFRGVFEGNELSLIQVWNEDDFHMLKQNLLGHVFAKKKNKLPLTLFIGCTDNDLVISLDNTTGQVGLENPGQKQHHILAESLSEFLAGFEPSAQPYLS